MRFLRHAGHGLYFRLHTVCFPFCPVRCTCIRQSAFFFHLRPFFRNRSGIFSFRLRRFTRSRMDIFSFRLNTLGLYGNVLPHLLPCFLPFALDAVVAFQVQPYRQVFRQHFIQIHRDTFHTAVVRVYHGGLAVGVGIPFRFGMDDAFRVVKEIFTGNDSGMVASDRPGKRSVLFRKFLFPFILLQDYQVAPYLRVGVFREQVVRQTDGGQQVRLLHHQVARASVAFRIQYALRGDECHDTAVTHRVQPFQEEIRMHFLRRYPVHDRLFLVFRVKHGDVPEGYVGDGKVETVQERFLYLLEALRAYFLLRVQVSEHLARQQVFLECRHLRLRVVRQHRADERAHACRRLQHQPWAHLAVVQHIRYGVRYGLRGVECRQHRCFQRVRIAFVLHVVPAVFPDDAVQLHRRGEQFEVGFRPMYGIRQFPCRVQYALQSPEAAVPLQQHALPFGGRAPFPVERECRPYRLDVVPQLLFPIECHRTPDKA